MAISKEEIEQAKADEKQKKAQERMETEIYGKPVTAPTTPTTQPVKKAKGGSVGSASKRADGIAMRGKTRGKIC